MRRAEAMHESEAKETSGDVRVPLPSWSVLVLVCALTSTLAVGGCAPRSPDHPSWVDQAERAVADVAGEVATAALLLRQTREGRLPEAYGQVVAQDAERAAGAAAQALQAEQPPPEDDARAARVSAALQQAADLIVDVRVLVVRGVHDARATALLDRLGRRLAAASADLAALTDALRRVDRRTP